MATAMTRFEMQLPQDNVGTPIINAVENFLQSLSTLCPYTAIQQPIRTSGDLTQYSSVILLVYGVFPVAQNATALGFLNTLNAALQVAGASPALCIAWQVTSEP